MDKYLKIEELRKERGISRIKLAKLAKCSYGTARNYERGTTFRFDAHILRKIAAVLNVKVGDLFI
jgi:transcriptional regulator with XRE-family HTH domain